MFMHLFSDITSFHNDGLLTKQGHHVSFHEQGTLEDVHNVTLCTRIERITIV